MRDGRGQRGITLIELMVVLAIMGLLIYALAVGFTPTQSKLKSDARGIAGSLKYAFDRAMATGSHHRVILDLDEDTYRVERCEGKVVLHRGKDQKELDEEAERQKAIAAALGAGDPAQAAAGADKAAAQGLGNAAGAQTIQCEPVKGVLGRTKQMSRKGGIGMSKVFVGHLEDPVESGQVTVNFFPLGYAERALVEVSDKDGDVYTIVLHPLTGRVEVKQGELRKPEEFMTEDVEGKEVEP